MFQSIFFSVATTFVYGIIDVSKLYEKFYYRFFDDKIISFSKIKKTTEENLPFSQNIYSLWYRILNPFTMSLFKNPLYSFDCSQYLEISDKDVFYEIVHNCNKKQHTTIITQCDLKRIISFPKYMESHNLQTLLKILLIQKETTDNSSVFKFINKRIMYVGINNKYIVTDMFTKVKHSFLISPEMTAQMFIDYVLVKNCLIRNIIRRRITDTCENLFVTIMDDDFEEHTFSDKNRFHQKKKNEW